MGVRQQHGDPNSSFLRVASWISVAPRVTRTKSAARWRPLIASWSTPCSQGMVLAYGEVRPWTACQLWPMLPLAVVTFYLAVGLMLRT